MTPFPFVVRFPDGTETVVRSHTHHAALMARCRHENATLNIGLGWVYGCWKCLSADALEVPFHA